MSTKIKTKTALKSRASSTSVKRAHFSVRAIRNANSRSVRTRRSGVLARIFSL